MRADTRGIALACGVIVALGVVAGAGCARHGPPAAPGDLPLPVAPVVLVGNGMEVLWQTPVLLEPGTEMKTVWLVGDFLVGLGSDNRLYVVDAKTGVRLWSALVADAHETVWCPALDKGNLWVATTTRLMGFQGRDGKPLSIGFRESDGVRRKPGEMGEEVRRFDYIPVDFAPSGRPVTNGSHCFIPDSKGWLQAVSIVPGIVSWGRWTEDSVTAGPAIDGALVYFGSQNGVVYASAQNIRRIAWQYQTEGAVVADLKRTSTNLILAASLDYSLYAFQGPSGRLAWRYNAGERIRRTPAAIGGQAFVFTTQAGITALDATNGKPLWKLPEGQDVASADAETVYLVSRGNDLLAISRADGAVRFGVPMRRGALVAMNETEDGVLYLAMPNGQILATRKKGLAEKAAEEKPKEAEVVVESGAGGTG